MDVRLTWTKAGLIVLGCAAGGLGLAYLVCTVVLDRVLNPSR